MSSMSRVVVVMIVVVIVMILFLRSFIGTGFF